jgi:hypothetical protein
MPELRDVVVDCVHAGRLARFWDEVLDDYRLRPYGDEDLSWLAEQGIDDPLDDPSVALDPIGRDGVGIFFNTVPDPTPGKNRLHLDINLADVAELDRLRELGATVVSPPDQHGEDWWILADPEGNLFCAFPPGR